MARSPLNIALAAPCEAKSESATSQMNDEGALKYGRIKCTEAPTISAFRCFSDSEGYYFFAEEGLL